MRTKQKLAMFDVKNIDIRITGRSPMFKVEKGIPLPPPGRPTARRYPFHAMEIGDSFFVPWHKDFPVENARAAATRYQYRNRGWCFRGRHIVDKSNTCIGIRIWRTK